MRDSADKPFHPSYRLFMISDSTTWLRSLGARFAPEFCVKACPSGNRGAQGRPGARRHPWPPCMKKHGEGTTGVGGVIRPSLRNGFTAYTRSPRGPTGDRAGLPRHTQALNEPLARLAPASGRQDHTISPSATRTSQEATRRFRYPSADTPYEGAFSTPVAHCPRPSHPASNVRDDREAPLVIEAGQR